MDKVVFRSVRAGLKHSSGCFYKTRNSKSVTGSSVYFSKIILNLCVLHGFFFSGRKENISCVYRLGVLQFNKIVRIVERLAFCSSVIFRMQFLTSADGNKNRGAKIGSCGKRCAGSFIYGRKLR